jgi:hypothetical protein
MKGVHIAFGIHDRRLRDPDGLAGGESASLSARCPTSFQKRAGA